MQFWDYAVDQLCSLSQQAELRCVLGVCISFLTTGHNSVTDWLCCLLGIQLPAHGTLALWFVERRERFFFFWHIAQNHSRKSSKCSVGSFLPLIVFWPKKKLKHFFFFNHYGKTIWYQFFLQFNTRTNLRIATTSKNRGTDRSLNE